MSLINQPTSYRPSWSTGDKICTSCLGRGGGRQAERCGHVYLEGSWVAQKGVLWTEFRFLTVRL